METLIRTHPLTTYRLAQNPPMSLAGLGRLLGVGTPTISRWEKFQRAIDEDRLADIASKTGIPAKELRPDLFEKNEQLTKIFAGEATQ